MRGRVVGGRLAVVAAGCGLMLAGCAGSSGGEPTDYGAAVGNLLAFNSLKAPSPPPPSTVNDTTLTCPPIEVLDGTASARVYGAGEQSNSTVRHQFSLGDAVRECAHEGGNLVLKIGVEGRVVLGPAGAPGSYAAPVRIAVRREKDDKVVAAKFFKVPVTVPPGAGQAPFTVVSEPIAVPFVSAHGDDDYTILVGFDEKGGAGTADTSPRKPKRRG